MSTGTSTQPKGWLQSLKGKIVSITAFLVVVPALVNSALDVYRAVAKIPTTISENNNYELIG